MRFIDPETGRSNAEKRRRVAEAAGASARASEYLRVFNPASP
jgi:hypothetical protein